MLLKGLFVVKKNLKSAPGLAVGSLMAALMQAAMPFQQAMAATETPVAVFRNEKTGL